MDEPLVNALLDAVRRRDVAAATTTDDGRTAAELARAYGHKALIPLLDSAGRARQRRA